MRRAVAAIVFAAATACHSSASSRSDAGGDAAPPPIVITSTVDSTRFVTDMHMLAAGEMQISGEPLATAMGRNLANYSRLHLPPNLYFDTSIRSAGPWIDLPGFSTGVESYEYSKQPMNNLAFESGAGTSLAYAPLVNTDGAQGSAADADVATLVQQLAASSNAGGRFVFPAGTFPPNPSYAANNPIGWPGIWPTSHVFASFDPTIAPTNMLAEQCSISSDDNPGESGSVPCSDFECDATTLHLVSRSSQVDPTVTPGADGWSAWKYALWTLNYLQIMHDSNQNAVASVPTAQLASVGSAGNTVVGSDSKNGNPTLPGTFLGSSDIEGFQAGMFIQMLDSRAAEWLLQLTTADGATLSGFPTLLAALQYNYNSPLRWFPGQLAVTESAGSGVFPAPAYALASPNSSLMDLVGLSLGYATIYALTDTRNTVVGGSQPALAYFDGNPFPADDQLADGESTLHDRALGMIRVALVDMDRLHTDPASGVLVDDVTMSGSNAARGTTVATSSVAYALLALRTVNRSLGSQLALYSNETPDTAQVTTPLDSLALAYPSDATLTFSGRVGQMLQAEADLLYNSLTDDTGRAYDGWNVATNAVIDTQDLLDSHTAAVRGLFTAYLATGDVKYRTRAIAVFQRMQAVFYDPAARIYSATPAPVDSVQFTPLRFAMLQSALRETYELVAARPGGEAIEPELEELLGRLNKLVLNGWDDRNYDRMVEWPGECTNVVGQLPLGGLQMGERTLTGEIGVYSDHTLPGQIPIITTDREADCVPEIDAAGLPAALADAVTFHIARP